MVNSSDYETSSSVQFHEQKVENGSSAMQPTTRFQNPKNLRKKRKAKNKYFDLDGKEISFEPKQMDSRFVDSLQAFKDFGALVITDLSLETRPCKVEGEEKRRINVTRNSKINPNENEIENISIFKPDPEESNFPDSPSAYDLRTFFPETWIWDLIRINDSGSASLNLQVPDAITRWMAEVICLSENGLGIAEPSGLVTYKPFFLDFFVPRSLNRREIFHLRVSAFNYESFKLPVKITYVPGRSFVSRSEESASYCIRPKSKIVHHFVLEAVKLGEGRVTVKAEIDTNFLGDCGNAISAKSDVVIKKTTVKHEGFPVEEVKSGFICAGENSSNFENRVDWNIKIPPEVAESSISLEAFASGDILGPSLKNVDHLIALPTGCGEQNMILLVPNVLLLDYLLLTGAEDLEPIREKALKNLDLGYQRQLNYMRRDGSFSAFGDQDGKGSIWLTAFVVRYLSQAKKYVHVDGESLNSSVAWIAKHQLENGCFPMIGKTYHRKFQASQEKLTEEDSSKSLTAYILISLIESGIAKDNPVIKNAIFCLRPGRESLGLYGDLLSSYALILAGEYRDSQGLMMELIKEAKRSYGMLWWETGDSIESAIEMTGYGILTLLKLGGPHFLAIASDALRWILQYENKNGGFVSSQDTVLALEALSKFSATLPRTSEHDRLTVTLRASQEKHTFDISNSNKMLQQKVSLPPFSTNVQFESTGKGCALVQTYLRCNTRRGKPSDDLKVQLRIHSVSEVDSYSIAKFHICVRYKTAKDKINMAVLEVAMVSGYSPDRSSLYEIRTTRKGVRRWEEYENQVNFYFEDLKSKKVCVSFVVVQEACVENAAPALIKLYDYYDTQHQTTMKYNLASECQNSSRAVTATTNRIKQESKRELRYREGFPVSEQRRNLYDSERFEGFVDFEPDLETPSGIEGVMPVYAMPPNPKEPGRRCAHCLTAVPELFPRLYCSSRIALKVLVLSKETVEFLTDVSPRIDFTPIDRIVSITTGDGCECSALNSVNTYALLMVTYPRSFNVQSAREIHLDDSVQIYPWGNPGETPEYLRNAMRTCRRWWTFGTR